jgi:hypothetical protein
MSVFFRNFVESRCTVSTDNFLESSIAKDQSIDRSCWANDAEESCKSEIDPICFHVYMNEAWIANFGSGVYWTLIEGEECQGTLPQLEFKLFNWWNNCP